MTNTTQSASNPGTRPVSQPASVAEVLELFRHGGPFEPGMALARAFQPRPSDVFVATFPKSGTTWTQQIVHGLRTRGSMDFEEISLAVPFIEAAFLLHPDLDAPQAAAPRAYKTHLGWNDVPKGARYIYVIREPGDAAVSFYHFLDGVTFQKGSIALDAFVQELFIPDAMRVESYWAHLLSWWPQHQADNVLCLCFEDMKRDLAGAVRRVARFMEIEADQALLDLVTRQASFDFMRQHARQFDDHPLFHALGKMMGLPLSGDPPGKVRAGRVGDRDRALSADTRAALDAMWQREITATLGFASYDDLRAHVAALP